MLAALSATAQAPDDAPLRDEAPPASDLPAVNYLVPALEGATFSLGLLAFSNLVTRMDFALVTPETLLRNLGPRSWTFDVDYYLTNQFGHAYQGSLYFNAARSCGLSFWWAALYTTLHSLSWELFFEAEPPSVNDQLTTPIAGSLLGEALHRMALQLRRGEGPGWLSAIGATLLDPMGALNGALLDRSQQQEDITLDPLFMRWQLGASAGIVVDRANREPRDRMPPQALAAVLLVSGPPWDPRSTYDSPLSYFDLRADLSFPSKVVGNIFIRGLLLGSRFGTTAGRLRGVWGLFGDYDYAAPAIVRASAVGVGPGFIFQLETLPRLYLQAGGLLGVSPFAAAGQLLDVSPDLGRDYHVGPGLQSILDLRLLRPGWFQLELSARNWLVVGVYTPPNGFESITYVTFAASVPIWRFLSAGAEFTLSDRRANFVGNGGTEHDTGLSLRVTLGISSGAN
jgi:hypothetical protein